jgi:hypothetical protein
MSWASTIAGSISTPNRSSRMGRAINGWIIHHNAGRDGRGVLEMMRAGSKQVSANYQVLEDGDVWGVVPREERSWSASNAVWDAESLTFEIANNSGAPGWTISDRAYDRVARTIAEDARWAGIPINRTTVRGHREGSAQGAGGSYSTACPGGINLDYLVQLAQHYYNQGSSSAGGGATPITEEDTMRAIRTNGDKGARPDRLVGPLYEKPLTQEEWDNCPYPKLAGNDRQYDLWRGMLLNGKSYQPTSSVTIDADDAELIASKIAVPTEFAIVGTSKAVK